MKSMIWKELRENFKWALLAFLVLTLAEVYVLSAGQDADGALPLCQDAFLMTTAFGCSVIGAALGIVQILPELKRDRWAALLHRPVHRGAIYFGKAIAGLALYFWATMLPLLASIWYVAAPGHFAAPFVPGAVLPGLSDILLGIVFYFVAVLACLGRGRWFGVRGMLVLATVPVLVLHISGADAAVVLPAVASLILMLAARGALLTNGTLHGMPRWGKASYCLVALAGAQTAWVLLALCLHFLASAGSSREMYGYQDYYLGPDGRLLCEAPVPGGAEDQLTDMDGKVVTLDSGEGLNPLYPLIIGSKQDAVEKRIFRQRFPRNSENYASGLQYSVEGPEYWFFLLKRNYLVGYDRLSRRYIGLFDRNGFEPPGATPAPFPEPLLVNDLWGDPVLALSGSKVYSFDITERTLKTFFDGGNRAVYGTRVFPSIPGRLYLTAIALDNGFRVFDQTGRQLMAAPYQRDPMRWNYLGFGASKSLDRLYVKYQCIAMDYPAHLPAFVDEYDFQGHLLHTHSWPAGLTHPTPSRWDDPLIAYSAPLGLVAAAKAWSRFDPAPEAWGAWSEMPPSLVSGNLKILALIALLLAVATFSWARKTGFSKASALCWAAVTFLFGPAGLLAFRLATDWPVRVRCAACESKRPIEGERCPHCAQGWGVPERNGTEILDFPIKPHEQRGSSPFFCG